jgi:hypothetical protein
VVISAFKLAGCGRHRIVSILLLLTVFFLPLHFHSLTLTSQVAKECSCFHGVKTQTALGTAAAICTPPFEFSFCSFPALQHCGSLAVRCYTIRAPPPNASL